MTPSEVLLAQNISLKLCSFVASRRRQSFGYLIRQRLQARRRTMGDGWKPLWFALNRPHGTRFQRSSRTFRFSAFSVFPSSDSELHRFRSGYCRPRERVCFPAFSLGRSSPPFCWCGFVSVYDGSPDVKPASVLVAPYSSESVPFGYHSQKGRPRHFAFLVASKRFSYSPFVVGSLCLQSC